MEENVVKIYQVLKRDKHYTKSFDEFKVKYFSNENSVKELYDFLISNVSSVTNEYYYTKTINDFYQKYGCHLEWAKNTIYCNPTIKNWPSCVKGVRGQYSGDGKTFTYKSSNVSYGDVTLNFDNTYTSTGGSKGKWSCTQTGKIFLEPEGITSTTPPSTTGATTPPGFTPSPATSDDIKNGKLVKFGMTGNIVTEIQKLLIQKGYTSISKNGEPDGIFGIRTYNSVKKFQELNGLKPDGVVGPLTYGKLTDANAVKYDGSAMSTTSPTRSTSSSSNQPQIKECTDFPFSFGCKNPKIADIRKKLIGDNKDVYDQDLYNAVKEDLKVGDKRITQDVYNRIIGK